MTFHKDGSIYIPTDSVWDFFIFTGIISFYSLLFW